MKHSEIHPVILSSVTTARPHDTFLLTANPDPAFVGDGRASKIGAQAQIISCLQLSVVFSII